MIDDAGYPVYKGHINHVPNTIMDKQVGDHNAQYDVFMVKELRNIHGCTGGANVVLEEDFKSLAYNNYSKQNPNLSHEDVVKAVDSMTTWAKKTIANRLYEKK